jgi:hypothetical protein
VSDDLTNVEATEYVRELSDEQLVGLTVEIGRRITSLNERKVLLPMQQIENHHLIGLLECFVGPEDALRVREWHLTWLDRYLDAVDTQERMREFLAIDGAS